MPTSLPTTYSGVIVTPTTIVDSLRPIWLLVAWTIVMFSMSTFTDRDVTDSISNDPSQLAMPF